MLGKSVKVGDDRWVMISEFPDGSLGLTGIVKDKKAGDDGKHDFNYLLTNIRFSKEAIEGLIPLMQKWIDSKKGE